jgi:hypothetical protein
MDGRAELRRVLADAQNHVALAVLAWDASERRGCEECRNALEAAVREIRIAERQASRMSPDSLRPLATTLRRLRAEVRRLGGLVDSALAFARGMEVIVGHRGAACRSGRSPAAPRLEESA